MDDTLNHQAEVAVLSLILKNPVILEKCESILEPFMFLSSPNRNLYTVILELKRQSLTPDYSLVVTTLINSNTVANCGGENYLKWLVTQSFDEGNFDEFVSYVINGYQFKELMSISTWIPSSLVSSGVSDTLLNLTNNLERLKLSKRVESIVTLETASKDMWNTLVRKINDPNKISVTTGFTDLDMATAGFESGDLWVIAGRTSMGKSASMCNFLLSGVPSLVFSLEMSKVQLAQRLVAIKSGVPAFNIRLGSLSQKELDKVATGVEEIKTLPIYIDTTYNTSPETVVSTIRKYHSEYGIKVVYLDYLQLLVERDTSATHDLGKVTRLFKLLMNDLGIAGVLLSQVNRACESRDNKRPLLSDLRQSGNIEEDADIVIYVYRDYVYDPNTKKKDSMEFIIRKQRNGPTGTLFMEFDESTNRIKST